MQNLGQIPPTNEVGEDCIYWRLVNLVLVNVNVNKRRMNINITALSGLPEGVNAVFNGRKFDHVNQSNRRKFINCIRIGYNIRENFKL